MKTTRRARWAWGAAMGAVGIILLSACNPISQAPQTRGAGWSTAKLIYDGPADAWIEVGVTGIAGYRANTETAVWKHDPAHPPAPSICGSATDRAVPVPCHTDYPEFPYYTDRHQADLDPAGTYWPAILLHPGEHFEVHVRCSTGGPDVICPPEVKVEARSVDANGKLIGDLHGPS
jgi:hypothetical protein